MKSLQFFLLALLALLASLVFSGNAVAASAATLIVVGTVVYKLLEDWSWVDAVYFSVVAVTTVGLSLIHI